MTCGENVSLKLADSITQILSQADTVVILVLSFTLPIPQIMAELAVLVSW